MEEVSCYSLLKININQVKMMSQCDLPTHYYKYIPMFEEYLKMRREGSKMAYIIAHLSNTYGISESTVKRVVRALSQRVTV